ncbi:hypothetical protein [Pseudomonas sp. PB101]|jgi:hypothetical protein|uniref:hypothetical protein n=1 Tax=Pseudomonas sp. PB101 TaxID=2495428 RepID=UPI0015B686BA|nr:hypothetical protein [Pseudomonas sp. PB101]
MTQAVFEKLRLADMRVVVTGKKPAILEKSSRVLSFQAVPPNRAVLLVQQVLDTAAESAEFGAAAA